MLHLALTVPADLTDDVMKILDGDPRIVALTLCRGIARHPSGDAITCDVAREGAHDVLEQLMALGVTTHGTLRVEQVDAELSELAERAEVAAPGAPDDGVVWPLVHHDAWDGVRPSWSYFAFLTLATQLAACAVILDSSVLVVGAMVVAPDFAPVAGLMVAAVLRDRKLGSAALRQLVVGFATAIAITLVCALAFRVFGSVSLEEVVRPRPQTAFIWHPDKWSFIVALLAGAAGVLSLTSGRSAVMVGVFISVTTVPAAGNLALGLAFLEWNEIRGSALQLVINIFGLLVAGVITLLIQKVVWVSVGREFRARRFTRERRRLNSGPPRRG